jgi:hypothetical protein
MMTNVSRLHSGVIDGVEVGEMTLTDNVSLRSVLLASSLQGTVVLFSTKQSCKLVSPRE